MITEDQIQNSIDHWNALADQEQRMIDNNLTCGSDKPFLARIETYRRTARSLEIQRDTGVAVCVCCYQPFGRGNSVVNRT